MATKKGKKKLSKKERIALKIKKIQERGQKEIERQIAKAQGIKDKHGDKTQKLRDKMKAQKEAGKKKLADLKVKLEKKLADKVAKAAAKAEKKAKRQNGKVIRKLGGVIKTLQKALNAATEQPVVKVKTAVKRSEHPAEPAVEAKPLS